MGEAVAFKVGEWVEARGVGLGPGQIILVSGYAKTPYSVRWEQDGVGITLSFTALDLHRIHAPRKT